METYRIHLNGIVQGVGFRPMVYRLAKEMLLNGYVKNGNNGLTIFLNATAETASRFLDKITREPPPGAVIKTTELTAVAPTAFHDFAIVEQKDLLTRKVHVAPDHRICPRCRQELHDPANRRFRYPFITCTECGPRYSIVRKVPYERKNTTMHDFKLCSPCRDEYQQPPHRRFFSQTNSCGDCGIRLDMHGPNGKIDHPDTDVLLRQVGDLLNEGRIVAVKSTGGYLLLCDAANAPAVLQLRKRKSRITKPFALLYPDKAALLRHCFVSTLEMKLLESPSAPIVLLYPRPAGHHELALQQLAPGLSRVGVMLPNSPLLDLIASDLGRPLVATSANLSGSPIIFEEAFADLFQVADYVVSNNREIVVPLDDSVVQVSRLTRTPIVLRRGRGYAPSFLHYTPQSPATVLATGARQKSTFALAVNGQLLVSQFLGNGSSYEAREMYRHTLSHCLRLYDARPDVVITDLHPGYFSHQYGQSLADETGASLVRVQHHHAHFAAVLADNDLLSQRTPILGVIWDGTGLGEDGHTWGGEFFVYNGVQLSRFAHADYFKALAGDVMAQQPRVAALSMIPGSDPLPPLLLSKFSATEAQNYRTLLENTPMRSSSIGRLFDAVSSLLGCCDKQHHEGEAASYLQVLAESYVTANGYQLTEHYGQDEWIGRPIATAAWIRGILFDLAEGKTPAYIAAKFYYSLVNAVDQTARAAEITRIAFSGGVFQSALLVDWIRTLLAPHYDLFFHRNLSPNDECISFGQLAFHDHRLRVVHTQPAEALCSCT